MGCGPVLYSNVILSVSLLYLAKVEANCDGDDDNLVCDKVYGFDPRSINTTIGTISGLMAAFMLPLIGAITDSTRHRRTLGIITAAVLMSIQAIQIYTVQETWFIMSILQAINGFLYQVLILTFYAYLPEIGRDVGGETMNKYSSGYYVYLFGTQVTFAVVIIALAAGFQLSTVPLAMLSQALNVPVSGFFFFLAWRYFTPKEPKRILGPNESVLTSGFLQVFRTAKGIYNSYGSTLGMFLLAVVMMESGANAFTVVAVTYLEAVVEMDGTQIGVVFLIVLISTIPGSFISRAIINKTNPLTSLKIQLCFFISFNFLAFLTMTGGGDKVLAFVYAAVWGVLLGWFYPSELLIFSMIMPEGQESELSGFYMYCTQILGWLPPLVFTIMNERGINLSWGGIHLNIFLFIGLCFLQLMPTWEKCVEVSNAPNKISIEVCNITPKELKDRESETRLL